MTRWGVLLLETQVVAGDLALRFGEDVHLGVVAVALLWAQRCQRLLARSLVAVGRFEPLFDVLEEPHACTSSRKPVVSCYPLYPSIWSDESLLSSHMGPRAGPTRRPGGDIRTSSPGQAGQGLAA